MKRFFLLSLLCPMLTLAQESTEPETKVPTVWDLTDLFPSVEAWETTLIEISDGISVLESYQGKLSESAALLEAALKARSALSRKLGRVRVYASLKADEDLGEAGPRARKQRVSSVSSRLWQSSAWMSPEIIAMGPEKIEAFIAEARTRAF